MGRAVARSSLGSPSSSFFSNDTYAFIDSLITSSPTNSQALSPVVAGLSDSQPSTRSQATRMSVFLHTSILEGAGSERRNSCSCFTVRPW